MAQLAQQQAALSERPGDRRGRAAPARSAQGTAQQRCREPSRKRKAQRDQARLNLSYTTVTAAQPGESSSSAPRSASSRRPAPA